MSSKQEVASEELPPTKEWNIPEEIEAHVLSKCPNGLSLVCRTCSVWDDEKSKFGTIYSRSEYPFSWGRFSQHTRTECHKSNERKRDFWHAENEDRQSRGLPKKKRQKQQSVLSFATKTPSREQVYERIQRGKVPPALACGNNINLANEISTTQEKTFEIINVLEEDDNSLKKVCCGIIANKDLKDPEVQLGLLCTEKYCAQDGGILLKIKIKEVKGTENVLSLFPLSCEGESACVKWRGTQKQSSSYGRRCNHCQDFLDSESNNFLKNKRTSIIKKGKIFKAAEEVRDGVVAFTESKKHDAYISALVKSSNTELYTKAGRELRAGVKNMKVFFDDMNKKKENYRSASNFISDRFISMYEKHQHKVKNTLVFGLFHNMLQSFSGNMTHAKGEKAMNFWMMLHSISPQAFSAASANLSGPRLKSLRRHIKSIELETNPLRPIIDRHTSIELCAQAIIENHKAMFSKNFHVAFSMSGDATKVAKAVCESTKHRAIVGGAAPDHFIKIPSPPDNCADEDEYIKEFIIHELESFNGEKPSKKKAAEINLATVTYQAVEGEVRKSPFFQVSARPQTKNESSRFNEDMAEACAIAEHDLRKQGYNVSFTSFAADAVSASTNSLCTIIRKFLTGSISYSAHTDTNHNMKNGRYQYVIGGNRVKTIGNIMIDTGLLKKADVSQDLWRIKDFASDLLVLKLASAKTVASILSVECGDPDSAIALSTTLFFIRAHLFAVNSKGSINAKQRVVLLWSTFIYMLHIDGVHRITKRNLMLECISMSFLMLRSDIVRPSRLTTEPSEHSIALIRRIIPEGTVNDFMNSISRMQRLWVAVTKSALKTIRGNEGSSQGYIATVNKHGTPAETATLECGPVKIESDNMKIEMRALTGASCLSVAQELWKELFTIVNETNQIMIKYLRENFDLKEIHPFAKPYLNSSSPEEILQRMETAFVKTDDDMFKSEKDPEEHTDNKPDNVENKHTDQNVNTEDHDQLALLRDQMVLDVVALEKGKKDSEKDDVDEISLTDDEIEKFAETYDDGSGSPFDLFLDVIKLRKENNSRHQKRQALFDAMKAMSMGKREKGDTTALQKTKSLLARWFGVKKEKENQQKEGHFIIERGSVVQIRNSSQLFVVFEVFKTTAGGNAKSGKWFPALPKDHALWPAVKQDLKKFRFGVREVTLEGNKVLLKSGVIDGVNVRKTYRLVQYCDVVALMFKVDGL